MIDEELLKILKNTFGYNDFRPHQKDIIKSILNNKDTLAILPTGAGKSICYQLPAIIKSGPCIVISPLIALMQDQVDDLRKNGINAAYLNSSLNSSEFSEVMKNFANYDLIYLAPERLALPDFLEFLINQHIELFVIDEAHCISSWGHDFRADYRTLSLLKTKFPLATVAAFTATATDKVMEDIIHQLKMESPFLVKSSFDRENLTIRIHDRVNPNEQLFEFLDKNSNKCGIIYASTRKSVEKYYQLLKRKNYSVAYYHAGLSDSDRRQVHRSFIADKIEIMVATVAFGMGIHKPDVRFVVHMDMPKNIEQYYQEIGRAGRDGLPSDCMMFFSNQDVVIQKRFSDDILDKTIKMEMHRKTDYMYSFCSSVVCRRKDLLKYFSETYSKSKCDACDNCCDEIIYVEGDVFTQKILSCVYRLKESFGVNYVIDILHGSKIKTILDRHHDTLSTYGLLKDISKEEIRYYIFSLVNQGYLRISDGDYPLLKFTSLSKNALKGNSDIKFRKRHFKEKTKKTKSVVFDVSDYDKELFEKLRAVRKEIADTLKVPPYVVFHDKTLVELSLKKPKNESQFLEINGVGPQKVEKYSKEFLFTINNH